MLQLQYLLCNAWHHGLTAIKFKSASVPRQYTEPRAMVVVTAARNLQPETLGMKQFLFTAGGNSLYGWVVERCFKECTPFICNLCTYAKCANSSCTSDLCEYQCNLSDETNLFHEGVYISETAVRTTIQFGQPLSQGHSCDFPSQSSMLHNALICGIFGMFKSKGCTNE